MLLYPAIEPSHIYRVPTRVLWHANGGFTRVDYWEGRGHNEIATDLIPSDLRAIGSRFTLVIRHIDAEHFRSFEELGERLSGVYSVERL